MHGGNSSASSSKAPPRRRTDFATTSIRQRKVIGTPSWFPARPFCVSCSAAGYGRQTETWERGMVRVTFTPTLQRHIACPPVEVKAATVREALESAFAGNARARAYVLDDQSALR